MRLFYWAGTTVGVSAMILLILYAPIPSLEEVPIDEVEAWLAVVTFAAVVAGAVTGLTFGISAPLTLLYRPREAATQFYSRVVRRGFWAMTMSGFVGIVITFVALMFSGPLLLTLSESIAAILTTRLAAVPVTAISAGAITFLVAIRARNWGGQHALSLRLGR
jgi:hypothetical protein